MARLRTILIASAALLPIGGCGWFIFEALDPHMRGPRGYYVQKEDPSIFIEFFEKPRARSNVSKEFGDAEYSFDAFDREIDMHGPTSAPAEKRRHYAISGEGEETRVQDLSAEPIPPKRVFPVTNYIRIRK